MADDLERARAVLAEGDRLLDRLPAAARPAVDAVAWRTMALYLAQRLVQEAARRGHQERVLADLRDEVLHRAFPGAFLGAVTQLVVAEDIRAVAAVALEQADTPTLFNPDAHRPDPADFRKRRRDAEPPLANLLEQYHALLGERRLGVVEFRRSYGTALGRFTGSAVEECEKVLAMRHRLTPRGVHKRLIEARAARRVEVDPARGPQSDPR
jgi:hypothetical protein